MDDSGVVAIIAILSMFVLAIVAGFWLERYFSSVSWLVAYVVGAFVFAIISVALFVGLTWLEWYLVDSSQAALIAEGTVTNVASSPGKTIYEVDLPNGAWARVLRYEFDAKVVENVRIGILAGMVLGAVLLLARRVVRWCWRKPLIR